MKTIVIAFEGIDGSGKTVQMDCLARTLKQVGMQVATLSFPRYESFFGREIGKLLSASEGVSADEVDAKSMCLWFALDRFDAWRNRTDQHADVLLINRYVLSNAVYQSIRERDLGGPDLLEFVYELEHERFGIPVPDLYVYLDVTPERARDNIDQKGYRDYIGHACDVYEAQWGIQERARAKYLEYAKRLHNVLVLPCMEHGKLKSQQEIAHQVTTVLQARGFIPNIL